MMRADGSLREMRFRWQHNVLESRAQPLYLAVRPRLKHLRVLSDTDLVIEGFARSGTSFARASLLMANPHLKISSHLHSARCAQRAVRVGIPCLILVRDPADSVASSLQFQPGMRPATAFRMYAHFTRDVMPYLDGCLVAKFEDVGLHFSHVVDAVNTRFSDRLSEPLLGETMRVWMNEWPTISTAPLRWKRIAFDEGLRNSWGARTPVDGLRAKSWCDCRGRTFEPNRPRMKHTSC